MKILFMNPIRGRAEECAPVARAETELELVEFVNREAVDPYKDGQWTKFYRQGGPLEWYNQPTAGFFQPIVDLPNREEYMRRAGCEWDRIISNIPHI